MLRLNKKGITHVDWAISMGIFIIYVSFLIIFIMPSLLKTQFDPSTLFDSFEKNFLKPLEWTVVKIPLNIEKLKKYKPGGGLDMDVVLDFEFEESLKPDYKFTKIEPDNDGPNNGLMTVKNELGGGGQLIPTDNQPKFDFVNQDQDKIRFNCEELSCEDKLLKFTVASLERKNEPKYLIKCEPEDVDFCKASIGIEEEINGVKEKPFLSGANESASFKEYKDGAFSGYSILKTDYLKFSDNLNFDILYLEDTNNDGVMDGSKRSIFDQSGFTNPQQKPPTVPDNANVFIKEFKRFYVNEFGDLKPVVFYFETW